MAKLITPGEVVDIALGVRRVTVPKPGVMTCPDTNSYIVGRDAFAAIDPGPDNGSHVARFIDTVGARLKWIFCTYTLIGKGASKP